MEAPPSGATTCTSSSVGAADCIGSPSMLSMPKRPPPRRPDAPATAEPRAPPAKLKRAGTINSCSAAQACWASSESFQPSFMGVRQPTKRPQRKKKNDKLASVAVATMNNQPVVDRMLIEDQIRQTYWYMVDPRRHARKLQAWDTLVALALCWVTIATPFESAFLPPLSSPTEPLFILGRVIDAIFILDLVLQFFLVVRISTRHGMRWVSHPLLVAVNYVRGWFIVDITSIAVSAFDYIGVTSDNPQDVISDLRLLRVLRALRLIKLAKLFTAFRLFRRWEVQFAINYEVLSLCRCMIGMVVLSHWSAAPMATPTAAPHRALTGLSPSARALYAHSPWHHHTASAPPLLSQAAVAARRVLGCRFACVWALQANFSESRLTTWMGRGGIYCKPDTNATTGESCVDTGRMYARARKGPPRHRNDIARSARVFFTCDSAPAVSFRPRLVPPAVFTSVSAARL